MILDASWTDPQYRDLAHTAAIRAGAEIVELQCVVDAAVARRRIEERAERHHSEATPSIAEAMAVKWSADHWDAAVIDTSVDVDTSIACAGRHWRG